MNITKTTMLYNDYGEEKDKMIEIHDPLICHPLCPADIELMAKLDKIVK